ncbi:MAG: PIN domain-containing protein, partial [Bacteroidota bacterium]
MAKQRAIVFDTWAIIAYYEDEPAGEKVAGIIADANERGIPMWMSVVNAGEVWYIVARETSPAEADQTIEELRSLGVELDNAEWKISRQAAMFKSKNKMSYANA